MQALLRAIRGILLFSMVILCFIPLRAQNFEGEIVFTKETLKDTTYYSYKIKDNMVRFEELNNNQELVSYIIADLSKKNIFTINPRRKLYIDMPVYPWKSETDTINYKIIKTENYKSIKGLKCYQWRVQNKKENTEIAFWVAPDHYNFYTEFLKMVNQSDKISQYYLNVSENTGYLPLESVERSMLREWRMCLNVVKIQKKTLPAVLFEIPAGYKIFQKN